MLFVHSNVRASIFAVYLYFHIYIYIYMYYIIYLYIYSYVWNNGVAVPDSLNKFLAVFIVINRSFARGVN